jgi:CheY-like chemotaxis protein
MRRRKPDGPSILIIDDDSNSREALAELLADDGYVVVAATNGAEGLAYLRSGQRADVILLDLMMPGVDGWDFRAEQKRDAALAQIPVVVMSAAGKLLDADYALRKPLDVEALRALLRNILGAPS